MTPKGLKFPIKYIWRLYMIYRYEYIDDRVMRRNTELFVLFLSKERKRSPLKPIQT